MFESQQQEGSADGCAWVFTIAGIAVIILFLMWFIGDGNPHPENGRIASGASFVLRQSIEVQNHAIRVGDTFDSVVAVLPRTDSIDAPIVRRDGLLPDSLVVTHTYRVKSRIFRIEARRNPQENGPYRVSRIWIDVGDR